MRSLVGSGLVTIAAICMIAASLGQALAETADGLEPAAVVQAAPGSPPPAASVAPGVQVVAGQSANPLWDVPISALSATRDRPIFSASRRPPPVAPPAMVMRAPPPPPPQEPERPNLQLVGTVIGHEESFGIFVDASSQASLRLRVGAAHEGWVLQSLRPREALLQKAAETVTLQMPQLGTTANGDMQAAPITPPPGGRERMARRAR
ncbi:general secretion pathway protein GspN [Bradyrhizobium sp. 83002]|uniref:general secretion pathway protein GspN n=1 Tax=Bradyrhizobium aeschynomenes TaxID=2734909 RepID=UPI001551E999|nr:general secretion pathway protein GspN [Bradyrhizobium aeschynomenes]NPU10967.1 general secretion pathway protein GspN [Bradyrhizobium aeschynomenes]